MAKRNEFPMIIDGWDVARSLVHCLPCSCFFVLSLLSLTVAAAASFLFFPRQHKEKKKRSQTEKAKKRPICNLRRRLAKKKRIRKKQRKIRATRKKNDGARELTRASSHSLSYYGFCWKGVFIFIFFFFFFSFLNSCFIISHFLLFHFFFFFFQTGSFLQRKCISIWDAALPSLPLFLFFFYHFTLFKRIHSFAGKVHLLYLSTLP